MAVVPSSYILINFLTRSCTAGDGPAVELMSTSLSSRSNSSSRCSLPSSNAAEVTTRIRSPSSVRVPIKDDPLDGDNTTKPFPLPLDTDDNPTNFMTMSTLGSTARYTTGSSQSMQVDDDTDLHSTMSTTTFNREMSDRHRISMHARSSSGALPHQVSNRSAFQSDLPTDDRYGVLKRVCVCV